MGEGRGETTAGLGQLLRCHAMDGAAGHDDVAAARRVVVGHHHQIESAPAEARILDLHEHGLPAIRALHRDPRRGADAPAGDQQIRPGRRQPVAIDCRGARRVGPQERRQVRVGKASDEALLDERQPDCLGEAENLVDDADAAVVNRPHQGLATAARHLAIPPSAVRHAGRLSQYAAGAARAATLVAFSGHSFMTGVFVI